MYLALPGCIKLLLNEAHYKSDCILLAIFREMLNESYFKLLAYVPTLPRLLVLHKTLQRFLWNVVNITEIQERCSAPWRVCCTSDASVALTTSCGTRQLAHVSFTAKLYRYFHIFIDVSYRTQNIAMHRYTGVLFHPYLFLDLFSGHIPSRFKNTLTTNTLTRCACVFFAVAGTSLKWWGLISW